MQLWKGAIMNVRFVFDKSYEAGDIVKGKSLYPMIAYFDMPMWQKDVEEIVRQLGSI